MNWREWMFGRKFTLVVRRPGGNDLVREVSKSDFRKWKREGWVHQNREQAGEVTMLDFFFRLSGHQRYRKLVEFHYIRKDVEAIRDEMTNEITHLPTRLQEHVQEYLDRLAARYVTDKRFWISATCNDAFALFVEAAVESLPLVGVIESEEDAFQKGNHDLSFSLFQVPTLNFAYVASFHPRQREFMGIRRGFFG